MAAFLKFVAPPFFLDHMDCDKTKPVAHLRGVLTKVLWQARQLPKTTIALSPPYICHRLHLTFVTGDTLYLSQVEKKLAQPIWSPSEAPAETYCSARPPFIPTRFILFICFLKLCNSWTFVPQLTVKGVSLPLSI